MRIGTRFLFDVYRVNGVIKLHDLGTGEVYSNQWGDVWTPSAYTLRWIKTRGQLVGKNLRAK